eukprot:6229093-Alexandrium_andersonii.AAC.1
MPSQFGWIDAMHHPREGGDARPVQESEHGSDSFSVPPVLLVLRALVVLIDALSDSCSGSRCCRLVLWIDGFEHLLL